MLSLNAKNLESALLADPHVAVMSSGRTLTCSAKVSCRTLQIAEPKALNLEKDYLAEPWNAGSFCICPNSHHLLSCFVRQVYKGGGGNGKWGILICLPVRRLSARLERQHCCHTSC